MGFAITQFTSNTSTAAMLAPLIVGIGRELGMGAGGVAFAVVSSALATSFALMFPVSTPPNAIVYGSGYIRMNRMAIVGLIIGLIWMAALMPLCWILVPRALRAM
jgi:sodium-dependent dicarboxylate transporter 2/3/5